MKRGPIAEIDLSALQHNLQIIQNMAGRRPVIAVVKADAYGHGSVAVSKKLLLHEGIACLGVAFTGEAITLREAGIDAKILVLFDSSDIPEYFIHDLIPVIQDTRVAKAFSEEAGRRGRNIGVHIKVDTGMGRLGFNPAGAVAAAVEISQMGGIRVEGLLSHFSEADLTDRSFAYRQIETFTAIKKTLEERLGHPLMAHMANSAAILSLKDALFDAVRPGLVLYGYSPFQDDYGLRPVMCIKTRILALRKMQKGSPVSYGRTFITKRDSMIAVVPVGYADGYSRMFSNNADMLVRGRRVPVVGRVCMDLTMVDVTDVEDIRDGDEVVLLGRQGDEMISAEELSARINTIPYDIVTSMGSRARKHYLE